MISASPNYLVRINAIFLLLALTILTTQTTAAASATGQQSSTHHSSKPQADPQRQHYHHLHSNIIPVKHLNLHGSDANVPTGGATRNEFDRLNNRRYYGGRVTRAQVREAVVKTAKHPHTNEIYVMGVASFN